MVMEQQKLIFDMKAIINYSKREVILIAYFLYYLLIAISVFTMIQYDFGYRLEIDVDNIYLMMDIFLLVFAFWGGILALLSINTNLHQRTTLSMILSFIFLDFPTVLLAILSFYAFLICNIVI